MPGARRPRMRPPRFAVVTIVRNEASRLPRLLASLEEFRERGGEVVVLDTGSEDGTPEVAAAAGCRVAVEPRRFNRRLTERQARRINETFSREGEGPFVEAGDRLFDFGRAREYAASLARNHVHLVVDGGDVIEALDVDFLDAAGRARGFVWMAFEIRVLSRHGWSVEAHDCFYDRRRLEWRGQAHNFLAPRAEESVPAPQRLGRDKLLVSHHTDLEKARSHQLAGVALEALKERGSFRWGYFLGRELVSRGHFHSALPLLLALDRPEVPPVVRSAGLCLASQCLAGSGAPLDEVEEVLFRASTRDSRRRDPLLRLARLGLARGDLQSAASLAAAALAIPVQSGFSEAESNHSTGPHAILYWALLWLGRREEARTHFEICRELDPGNALYAEHARFFSAAAAK